MGDVKTVLAVVAFLWGIVSTLVAWAFATGRFTGTTVTKMDLEKVETRLADRLECELTELAGRLESEHEARRRFVDEANAKMGRLLAASERIERELALRVDQAAERHGLVKSRLDKLEETTAALQRQIDRGAGAGV